MAAITSHMVDITCNAWAAGAKHSQEYDRIVASITAADPAAVLSTWNQVEDVASRFPVFSQGVTMRLLITHPCVTRRLGGAFWERGWYQKELVENGHEDLDALVKLLLHPDFVIDVREQVAIAALAQARTMKHYQNPGKEATGYYISQVLKLLAS